MIWLGILIAVAIAVVAIMLVRGRSKVAPQPNDPGLISGWTVMLCHRRAAGVGRDRVRGEWARNRTELVRRHREAIGFSAYVQVHQVSRLSLTYNLVRASRSWPLVALISILQRLPVPHPTLFDRETGEERWDVIEQFDFADREGARAFLAGAASSAARDALNDDARGVMRRTHAIFLRTTEAFPHRNRAPTGCYTLFVLRARPHLGPAEAMRYWLTSHRPFVVRQQPVLQFPAYYQHVAEDEPATASLSRAAGAPWDAVASLQYASFGDLALGAADPRVLVANFRLVVDENRFLETQRSSLMIGTPLARIA